MFTIENGILTGYDGPGGNVVIPEDVRVIAAGAFRDCTSLRSVTIPEGVREISGDFFSEEPYGAFSGCTSLNAVSLPESLYEIGCRVFSGCSSLRNITLPENVAKIGNRAFQDCESLKSITIPAGVREIDYGVFMGCTSLREAVLPTGVTVLRECAFAGCTALEGIDFPASLRSIGYSAFQNCGKLRRLILPAGVMEIGGYAFENCENLISVIIGKAVAKIGEHAFRGCPSLTVRAYADTETERYAKAHEIPVLTYESLRDAAEIMRKRAYAPYSHFSVGAALECEDGTVYTGCNVENASYPAGICAERNAIFHAVSEGQTHYSRIVVIGSGEKPCMPCGICRQVMAEFSPEMEVVCLNPAGESKSFLVKDLLPENFGPDALKNE